MRVFLMNVRLYWREWVGPLMMLTGGFGMFISYHSDASWPYWGGCGAMMIAGFALVMVNDIRLSGTDGDFGGGDFDGGDGD